MRTELVTTLKRKATDIIARVASEKEPLLITQYGLPAAYLIDVETFTKLQERLAFLEGVAAGEKALLEGRLVPHKKAKKRMERWLK